MFFVRARVLFNVRVTFARVAAFLFAAVDEFMVLDDARRRAAEYAAWTRPVTVDRRIGVDVGAAIDPGAIPAGVVDVDHVIVPAEAAGRPHPGTEIGADADAEAEADCAANEEARAGCEVHDTRIVDRDH